MKEKPYPEAPAEQLAPAAEAETNGVTPEVRLGAVASLPVVEVRRMDGTTGRIMTIPGPVAVVDASRLRPGPQA